MVQCCRCCCSSVLVKKVRFLGASKESRNEVKQVICLAEKKKRTNLQPPSVCLSCHRFASLSARCDCFDCRVMTFSMTDDYCVTDDVTASAPAANTRHNSTTIGTVQWQAWCDIWYTKGHAGWQGSLSVPSLDSRVVSLPTVMSVWSLKMQLKKVFGCGGDMPHPLWRLATSTPSPTQLIVNNSRTLHGRVITDEAIAEVSTM